MLPEFSEPTDRFVLEARACSGGMGDIFKALDHETGATVALKLLRSTASPQERARFGREIAMLADLRHPNIVRYIAHGTWRDGRLFFAMEWLDGEDLGQRQRRAPLGMRDAVEVVRRSAAAMAAIHARGIIHRDLKLSNIFLVRGKGTAVKLIDFGVVSPPVPDEYPTERGTIIGTPHFMAPEQARGEPIDARADVYSLGSVLFRLITGRNVFETEHVIALLGRLVLEDPPRPQNLRFDVPDALDQVIYRALSRDREQRYENGGELSRALARVGALDNDPPATDRSASAIRKAVPVPDSRPISSVTGSGRERPSARLGASERRVVACVLYDLGGAGLDAQIDAALRDVLGEDTRLEALLGGQMVAVLGVERSRGDEAMRAARAALTVAHAMPGARVSVAVGHAVRGRENLAGEALDRAARQLESAAPGVVRIDAYAAAALEGRFVVQEDAQGGALLREESSGSGARKLLGRATPTVGRAKEIALLQSMFSELVEDGTPRAALVTGPAGIGKSRVRSELIQRLETAPRPPLVLSCRGDPMSRGSSLSGLGRALRALMGVQDGERPHEQVEKVTSHVSTWLPQTLRFLAAFIGELTGVPFPDEVDEPLRAARASAQLMQSRLRMALEAYLRSRADRAPLVLVIEDMHWADDTTIDLVDWLLDCPELRLGVFAFAQPEIAARLPTLWESRNVTRLALPPLSPHASDRLVAAALPQADAAARAAIVHRAGGNALFLEELIRGAAEGRDELPMTVQALVQLRLDRLTPAVREALRAAAVFGQSFWTAGVEALLERPARAELAELEEGEIATRQTESRIADHTEWTFRQALVRDAAYASILEEDRPLLHLAAGAWLESVGDVDVGLIARHADAGGDLPRASTLYARATRQALCNGAPIEAALELADRGLACGAEGAVRTQLLLHKAQACSAMGRLIEGVQSADEAGLLAPTGSETWGEALRLAAAALIDSGRSQEGDARAAWALHPELAASLSAPLKAGLLAVRVRGLADMNQPREALELSRAAVQAAHGSGSLDATVRALDALLFAMPAGAMSEAIDAGTSLIDAAESAGDALIATRARLNTASVLNQVGMFEDAKAMLERALVDTQSRRMRILEGSALHNLGMSYARLGNLDAGIEHQRRAGRIADECQAARLRIQARVYEAVFLVWRGAPGDLGSALSLARWLVEETRSHASLQAIASFALARVQLARRAIDSALEAAREAHGRLADGPLEEWEEYIQLTLIEALFASGAHAEADAHLEIAFQALVARVEGLRHPFQRTAFLRRNDEVGRLVQLARERLGRTLPVFEADHGAGPTEIPPGSSAPPPQGPGAPRS